MAKEEKAVDASTLSLVDLVAALKAATGNDDESMKRRAQFEAEARERLSEKENKIHPHISVFSYPEGDIARPKPKLKCKMFWVGYDMQGDQLTPEEIGLLNLAEPGDYRFNRTDGSQEELAITGEKARNGKLERLEFVFPCRGDNRHNMPSMVSMLRQVFGQPTREDALLAELALLRAQLVEASM